MENFFKYLQSKNLSKSTQEAYLLYVNKFLNWCEKEDINCTKKDILNYLDYLQNTKNQSNITRRNSLIALNHYYSFLALNQHIISNPTALIKIRGTQKRQLYNVYSFEELSVIYDTYYQHFIRNFDAFCYAPKLGGIASNQRERVFLSWQRNYIMLGFLVYQGLATNELQKLTINNIDLNKGTIKIKSSKKSNERTLLLNASQIGALINYTQNIRPKFFVFCQDNEQLFLALPESSKSKTNSQNLMHTFKPLVKQIKTIDKNFLNFKQIRASVITYWIQTLGLRKAQYLAGHRYISSTEKYLPNDLENLIEDMAKYNPF